MSEGSEEQKAFEQWYPKTMADTDDSYDSARHGFLAGIAWQQSRQPSAQPARLSPVEDKSVCLSESAGNEKEMGMTGEVVSKRLDAPSPLAPASGDVERSTIRFQAILGHINDFLSGENDAGGALHCIELEAKAALATAQPAKKDAGCAGRKPFSREEIESFITPGDNGIIATLARQLLEANQKVEKLADAMFYISTVKVGSPGKLLPENIAMRAKAIEALRVAGYTVVCKPGGEGEV